jgi:ATP-dependent Lon protease
MQAGLLPLFPLEVVLLPGVAIPLHIFEPRYREMFAEVLESEGTFGIVLAKQGGILRTGCSASVVEVAKRYEDGRLDILTVGRRRFRILALNSDRAFLRASVEYFDDLSVRPAPAELNREALHRYLELSRVLDQEPDDLSLDDPELSFRLASLSADLDFRQTVLDMLSEAERMEAVAKHLEQEIEKQRIRAGMKQVSRQNGHGKHLPIEPIE